MTVSDRTRPWIWTFFTECKRAHLPRRCASLLSCLPRHSSTLNDTLERITTLDNLPHWFLSTVPGLVNLFLRPPQTNFHHGRRGPNRPEFPKCFRTLVVKIETTNSNSTRDFSKRINFTRVYLFVWSTLVVKIQKMQESTPIILKRITEDKEDIILLPVASPLSWYQPCAKKETLTG